MTLLSSVLLHASYRAAICDKLLEVFKYDSSAEMFKAVDKYVKHFKSYQNSGGHLDFTEWLKAWEFFGTEETEKGVQLPTVQKQ